MFSCFWSCVLTNVFHTLVTLAEPCRLSGIPRLAVESVRSTPVLKACHRGGLQTRPFRRSARNRRRVLLIPIVDW